MSRTAKIWLVIAASLVLLGCILFACTMTVLNWDFSALSTVQYETNTHAVSGSFQGISVTADTADIVFALSEDGKCSVECHEEEKARHSVTVENNVLVIKANDERAWYDHIGFHFDAPKITVYLPEAQYGALSVSGKTGNVKIPAAFSFESVDISITTGGVSCAASASGTMKIKTSTGNILVENTSVGELELSATTGDIKASGVTCQGNTDLQVSTGKTVLTDLTCKNLLSSGSTGNITMENVIATEKMSITRTTGNVKFIGSDAGQIDVKTSTGNISGSLMTDKVFITDTDTGKVDVPPTTTGGKCRLRTDTGNIVINIG